MELYGEPAISSGEETLARDTQLEEKTGEGESEGDCGGVTDGVELREDGSEGAVECVGEAHLLGPSTEFLDGNVPQIVLLCGESIATE